MQPELEAFHAAYFRLCHATCRALALATLPRAQIIRAFEGRQTASEASLLAIRAMRLRLVTLNNEAMRKGLNPWQAGDAVAVLRGIREACESEWCVSVLDDVPA